MHSLVIRSGGLGDFILTLPLLRGLRGRGQIALITRPAYADLIAGDGLYDHWHSVDGPAMTALMQGRSPFLAGEQSEWAVYTFLPDPGLAAGGWAAYRELASRPTAPPHVAARMCQAAGLDWTAEQLQTAALQRPAEPALPCLWIHPGSGSPSKNPALPDLQARARRWLGAHPGGQVVLSIGEADMALLEPARAAFREFAADIRVCPSLPELRRALSDRATHYIGGDTGVTHLAAALGIATTAIFRCTDPAIWRPLGPRVTIDLTR